MFRPEPSPPSPQKLSFSVCSMMLESPVANRRATSSGCCSNFAPTTFRMTSTFTASQSRRSKVREFAVLVSDAVEENLARHGRAQVRLTILAFNGGRERKRSDRRVRPTATPSWAAQNPNLSSQNQFLRSVNPA